MPLLKVNSIVNRSNAGAPTLTQGATIPSGKKISGDGNVNVVGIVNATSFFGDGTNISNYASSKKTWAIRLIIDPLPFRS